MILLDFDALKLFYDRLNELYKKQLNYQNNCKNCGAPLQSNRCEYCGSKY